MKENHSNRRRWRRFSAAICLPALAAMGIPYALLRDPPLLDGADCQGPWRAVSPGSVRWFVDRTAWNPARAERVFRQAIFDKARRMVDEAATCVLADFFLWNDWMGAASKPHRALSSEWASVLTERKDAGPGPDILVLTDPINRLYGEVFPSWAESLSEAEIPVLYLDPAFLPDSNKPWSRLARFYGLFFNRIGFLRRWADRPRISNPFDNRLPRLSLRQVARLLHFKANHRKVLITDTVDGSGQVLVTSLNPSDSSSAHGNSGLWAKGAVAGDALRSECALAEKTLEGAYVPSPNEAIRARNRLRHLREKPLGWADGSGSGTEPEPGSPRVRWLTEGAIARALEARLDGLNRGDTLEAALFYLSDRRIVRCLRNAAARGVHVRLILDPNRDAFGRRKNGIPNRPVAAELVRNARRKGWRLAVRWADTHGEQFHHKALFTATADGTEALLAGSANWTRRNLRGFNLEANLEVENAPGVTRAWRAWFDTAWTNADGLSWTLDYEAFAETGWTRLWKTWLYRFQERSGLSSF